MTYDPKEMMAVLSHEVARLEYGGDPLPQPMYAELLKEARSVIALQCATIYREREEARQKAAAPEPKKGPLTEFLSVEWEARGTNMNAVVDHLARRFLNWKLPKDFSPDNGISFNPFWRSMDDTLHRRDPTGTNLLNYDQAKAMVKHLLEIKE